MICALFAAKHIAKSLPIAFRPHFIGNRKIYFFYRSTVRARFFRLFTDIRRFGHNCSFPPFPY